MAYMILLGAGASFGSEHARFGDTQDSVLKTPPLGNQLFSELLQYSAAAQAAPQHIKDAFSVNFEDGMQKYYKHSDGNIMAFQRELAGYLANFVPLERNLYQDLLMKINTKRFVFCSLNYDLLFEQSASALEIPTCYGLSCPSNSLRLLKIHGSSNFWPDLGGSMFRGCDFSGFKTDVVAPVRPLDRAQSLYKCRTEDSLAPSIAMFAVGKAVKVCPDFIEEQYEQWRSQIARSSKIFIIGVRVHEIDAHIWKVLGDSSSDVFYFGFENDIEEFEQWKRNNNKHNSYFRLSDFRDSINTIVKLSR